MRKTKDRTTTTINNKIRGLKKHLNKRGRVVLGVVTYPQKNDKIALEKLQKLGGKL